MGELKMEIRTFKVRLYPTKQQEKQMFFQAGCARHVYNWCLAFQKSRYEDESIPKKEKFIPSKGLSKYFTAYKNQEGNEWLKDCDSMALVIAYTDSCNAFKNFSKDLMLVILNLKVEIKQLQLLHHIINV